MLVWLSLEYLIPDNHYSVPQPMTVAMIIRLLHMMHIMYLSLSMSISTIIILSLCIRMIPTLLLAQNMPLHPIIFKTQDTQGVLIPRMKNLAQAKKKVLIRHPSLRIFAQAEVLDSATVSHSHSVLLLE